MTVGQLRAEITEREFMEWGVYFGRLAQKKELAQQGSG